MMSKNLHVPEQANVLSEPTVSTIVPVYNGMQTLPATVNSLLSQNYPAHEIVLVDDGSVDDSVELINSLAEHPKIVAFSKPNGGVGDARNFGVARASGDFVAFCDQDDTWEPSKLSLQMPLFQDFDVGLVFSGVKTVYSDREAIGLPAIRKPNLDDLLEQNRISCCTAVVRRSLFDQVGGFASDPVMAGVDDWHLWLRLVQHCTFDSVREPLATHFIHGENYSLRETTMLNAALCCLADLSKPDHSPAITPSLLQNAECGVYQHYAKNLQHNSDFRAASSCYLNAWTLKKSNLRLLLVGLILKFTPRSLLDFLQLSKRRLGTH